MALEHRVYFLVLSLMYLHFCSNEITVELCRQSQTPTLCNYYLDVRNALNFSKVIRSKESQMSCFHKCGRLSRQGAEGFHSRCFCDSLCRQFGDCCVDYDLWCKNISSPVRSNMVCRTVYGENRTGYMMIDVCPPVWKNKQIQQKCEENSKYWLTILPVTDGVNYTLYKNIFCAICNEARNPKYWKVEVVDTTNTLGKNLTFTDIVARKTALKFVDHESYFTYRNYCKPQFPGCKNETSLAHLLRMSSSELERVCNSYAFSLKFCPRGNPKHEETTIRNLHCMICEGKQYGEDEFCSKENGGSNLIPPRTITFDFVALGTPSADSQDEGKTHAVSYRCDIEAFYDPFSGNCRRLNNKNEPKTPKPGKKLQTTHQNSSCVKLSGKMPGHVSVLSNGSVAIKGEFRPDVQFVVIDNSSFICRNKTLSTTSHVSSKSQPSKIVLQWITVIGFALSSTCLIFLLLTYTVHPDLRTTPGRCVMSLSCALLLYMACHVPLTSTSYPILCVGNAIILHYSLLSVFSWLSVLGFDITKRFGNQAFETMAVRTGRLHASTTKRCDSLFFKYCAYSWGIPLATVSTCIMLDVTDTMEFQYGQGQYCYISTSLGVIIGVIVPVAAILIFNITALVRTVLGIKKLQKDTLMASQRSPQTSFAFLCLKLTSLFGLTWILDIVFAFTQASFVEYLTVFLNSCQGLFICMGFCCNKRVLDFYKAKLGIASKSTPKFSSRSQEEESKRNETKL